MLDMKTIRYLRLPITKVLLLSGNGADSISIQTTLGCPFIPASMLTDDLCLEFKASAGYGRKFVEKQLGLTIDEEINVGGR